MGPGKRQLLLTLNSERGYVPNEFDGLRMPASDPNGLNRILVGLIDRFQRQMLADLQTFFAFVPGNQLNLGVGEAFGRQEGQHLMAEQMRVQRLRNAGHLPIVLNDLLNSARGERTKPPSLE
jgi:hypothetical protein